VATHASAPPAGPAPRRRRRGTTLSTYLLLGPGLAVLLAFFLAPLYYVFLFSTGERYQGVTKAAASINGELTSFSWERWRELLGTDITVHLFNATLTMTLWAFGLAELALLAGVLRGNRLPRHGGKVVVASLVVLVLPFIALPAGNSVARIAEITSENPSITLFFRSISTSLTVSIIAVLMAFPVAYYLAFCVQKTKYTWLLIVITPFLTSYLLRIFAWKVVLGDQGLINSGLASLGIISKDHPLDFLIYSQFTVMVVLTYAWVPFICLPIFIALENMDRKLLEAATDLGASRMKAFRKITLPLAAPGVVAAFLFVFIPSIGEYITPSLVGGTKGYMFGQAVADHFVGGAFDWQGGSVLALFLLLVVLFLTATTSKFLRAGGGTA